MPVDLSPLISQSTEDQVDEKLDDGIKHYTHIVSPPENHAIFSLLVLKGIADPSAQDIVSWARDNHMEVKAICGYIWVPELDPDKYDMCMLCSDAAGMHMRNAGE